ncbi:Mariner Mos1 transposase [Eumeta japonica]|uniref:Mariner Mos1 transposase n=1 Tax=Eumeta variegata TaxID=151549 RepID=A0A4C1WTM7_EUMVA|nr:Mariner Mos1 transposase [Eumeta japonica]
MKLSRALKEKRPQYYSRHDKIILLHDNARPHVSILEKNYLKIPDWEVLPHPPYSPDIAPSDYRLFRSIAHALSEQWFMSYEDTKNLVHSWVASKDKENQTRVTGSGRIIRTQYRVTRPAVDTPSTSAPRTMAAILLLLLLMRTSVGKHCGVDTSVDISEGERFEDDTIEYNGTRYMPDLYYEASDNKTRGCICKIVNCYRKCCGRGEIYHEESFSCLNRSDVPLTKGQNETMYKYFEEFEKLEKENSLMQVNGFNELNGCNNESCLFRTDSYKSHRLTKPARTGEKYTQDKENRENKTHENKRNNKSNKYLELLTKAEIKMGRPCIEVKRQIWYIRATLWKGPQVLRKNCLFGGTHLRTGTCSQISKAPDIDRLVVREVHFYFRCALVIESVEVSAQEVDVDHYCIEIMLYFNEKTGKKTLDREAYFRGKVYEKVEEYAQNYIAMIISSVFILLTIAVLLILPDMKKSLHGRNLLCHLCSMLVSFVCIAAMQISITTSTPTRKLCMIFCDMQKRFRRYCVYAFGLPLLLTVLLAALEFSPIEDHYLLPRMRKRECFLSGNGKLIYLYLPITLVCITNILLFVLITYQIVKTNKKTKKHLSSGDSKNSKANDQQRFKDTFNIPNIKSSTITLNSEVSLNVLKNFEDLEEEKELGKNTNDRMNTSETKQNSNTNYGNESGTSITEINSTRKCFEEGNLDLSKDDKVEKNTVLKEDRDSKMINETVSEIKSDKKDDYENQSKMHPHEDCNRIETDGAVEQNINSDKSCNDNQDSDCHISKDNTCINRSYKDETYRETEDNLNTVISNKTNETDVLRKTENCNTADKDNKYLKSVKTNSDKEDTCEYSQQTSKNTKGNKEENMFGTKVNTIEEH